MIKSETLNQWLAEIIEKVNDIGIETIPIYPKVEVKNMKRSFGRCRTFGKGIAYIYISSYMLDSSEEGIKETLAHEVLHAGVGAIGNSHGKIWQGYVNAYNKIYGTKVKARGNSELKYLEVPKEECYIFKCEHCGEEIRRFRKSNITEHPERYSHPCEDGEKGDIILISRPKGR